MKKIILCVLALCCLASKTHAFPADMTSPPAGSVLTANFTQHRHLNGIPKPIKSTGQMILWEGKGLLWTTISPFPNSILICKQGLYDIENRTKTLMVKAGGNSAMFDVMADIFNMKADKKINGFTIEDLTAANNARTLDSNSNWQIRFIPQHEQVRNFIKSITVEGNIQITHISILRPSGDHDEIDIMDHVSSANASREVKGLFND